MHVNIIRYQIINEGYKGNFSEEYAVQFNIWIRDSEWIYYNLPPKSRTVDLHLPCTTKHNAMYKHIVRHVHNKTQRNV